MTATALLEGRNLRKTYRLGRRTTVEALRGVDVRIESGEMVAIMGPSGSGKSTLMHILGLLHSPDLNHGPRPELSFGGQDMVSLGEGERTKIRARQMGFVFQDFNLVPTLTAIENVMLACDYAGIRGAPAARAGRRGPGAGRPRRPCRPPAGRAVRGRAAAGGDRSRARQQALADPGRRADGQPGLRAFGRGAGAPAALQPGARPDVHPGHPRSRGRARPATASSGCATAGSGTSRSRRCRSRWTWKPGRPWPEGHDTGDLLDRVAPQVRPEHLGHRRPSRPACW